MSAAPLYDPPIMRVVEAEESAPTYTPKPQPKPSIYLQIKSAKGVSKELKAMPVGIKEVLAQVCSMTESGSHRCFDGNLAHLASVTGLHESKVSRHLKRLVESGLLVVEGEKRTRRTYRPSEKLTAAYQSGDKRVLDTVLSTSYHSVMNSHDTVSRSSVHSVMRNISNSKEESKNSNSEVVELRSSYDAATAALQLKSDELAEVEAERELLKAEVEKLNGRIAKGLFKFAEQEKEIAELKAKLAKKETRKSKLHRFEESECASLQFVIDNLAGTDYEHADLPHYHEVVRNWAASKDERKSDWLATIRNWILRESKEGKLKTNPNSKIVYRNGQSPDEIRRKERGLVSNEQVGESIRFFNQLRAQDN